MDEMSVHHELGRLSEAVERISQAGQRRDDKLDRMLDKLEPLPGLVDDVAEIKPKVASLEAESHRRAGVIALISMMVGMFGVQAFEWAASLVRK
jgi:predicted regulator of amino acid metabolism with ACT domain